MNKKQQTGGSAKGGPGLGTGVKPRNDRVSIPNKGGYRVVPNSDKRGKQG